MSQGTEPYLVASTNEPEVIYGFSFCILFCHRWNIPSDENLILGNNYNSCQK